MNLTFDLYLQLSEGREEASSKGFNGSILFADTKLDCKHIQLGEEEKREGRREEKSGEGKEEEEEKEEMGGGGLKEEEKEKKERGGRGDLEIMTKLSPVT